jgi:hypothetical protein
VRELRGNLRVTSARYALMLALLAGCGARTSLLVQREAPTADVPAPDTPDVPALDAPDVPALDAPDVRVIDAPDVRDPGCRVDPARCDDRDLCTVDTCLRRRARAGTRPSAATTATPAPTTAAPPTAAASSRPPNCDDRSRCTTDRCDRVRGCLHDPIVCDDRDPCTANRCDPAQGCVFPATDCGGCADGQRDAFRDRVRYPEIAGCAGGFGNAGLSRESSPTCARGAATMAPTPRGWDAARAISARRGGTCAVRRRTWRHIHPTAARGRAMPTRAPSTRPDRRAPAAVTAPPAPTPAAAATTAAQAALRPNAPATTSSAAARWGPFRRRRRAARSTASARTSAAPCALPGAATETRRAARERPGGEARPRSRRRALLPGLSAALFNVSSDLPVPARTSQNDRPTREEDALRGVGRGFAPAGVVGLAWALRARTSRATVSGRALRSDELVRDALRGAARTPECQRLPPHAPPRSLGARSATGSWCPGCARPQRPHQPHNACWRETPAHPEGPPSARNALRFRHVRTGTSGPLRPQQGSVDWLEYRHSAFFAASA